ncbi:MAG: hypothetical protein FWJ92_10115 [Actinomycetes bacterium]
MTPPEQQPEEERRPPWPLIVGAVVVVLAVAAVILAQTGGDEPATTTIPSDTTATTPPSTEPPATTSAPATTAASTATVTTTPPTTAPATTTETTEPSPTEVPPEAIAVSGADVVRVDTATGATEILHELLFEAAAASDLALVGDGRAYLHLLEEDYWFTCESAGGRVEVLDLDTGRATTIASGKPALSPNGATLAYLTADDCYPDPEQPEFFATVYDTLVVADTEGNEISRVPLSAGSVDAASALVDLVWEDDSTLLVWDDQHTFYRVPMDTAGPIDTLERVDLPAVDVFAVHDGMALAAAVEADAGYGPIQVVSIADGSATPLGADAAGAYSVGMSSEGLAIVSAAEPPTLWVGVDLATGEIAATFESPWLSAIDW